MRDKQRLTVGVALAVVVAVILGPAEAEQQRRVKLHIAGSTLDSVLDTNEDGIPARVQNGIANGKPEQFLVQRESEFKDTTTPCQMPDGTSGLVRILLQTRGVYTSTRDGSQLFTQDDEGQGCLNPKLENSTSGGRAASWGVRGSMPERRAPRRYKTSSRPSL